MCQGLPGTLDVPAAPEPDVPGLVPIAEPVHSDDDDAIAPQATPVQQEPSYRQDMTEVMQGLDEAAECFGNPRRAPLKPLTSISKIRQRSSSFSKSYIK